MNQQIIHNFEKLLLYTKYMGLEETDPKERLKITFRIKSFKQVLTFLKKYDKNIEIKDLKEIQELPGIGKGTIMRFEEILKTGKLNELKEIESNPKYKNIIKKIKLIDELTNIINIGEKIAKNLVFKHNITSINDLIDKSKKKEILLNDKILLGLKYYNKYQKNIPRSEIDDIFKYLKNKFPSFIITICGSYRRGKLTSNDIDVLITKKEVKGGNEYLQDIISELKKDKFLIDDLTDKNFTTKYMGFCKFGNNPVRRIDIRFFNYDSYIFGVLYFTGSDEFNRNMRQIAKKLGYKLNEYGLYKFKLSNGIMKEIQIKVDSEKDIFYKLGIDYVSPDKR